MAWLCSPSITRDMLRRYQKAEPQYSGDLGSCPNVGALIIRIGFLGFLSVVIVKYTPNPVLIIQAETQSQQDT